jgi:hypothetical protein
MNYRSQPGMKVVGSVSTTGEEVGLELVPQA